MDFSNKEIIVGVWVTLSWTIISYLLYPELISAAIDPLFYIYMLIHLVLYKLFVKIYEEGI